MVLLDLSQEGLQQPYSDLVCTVVIVAVAGEVAGGLVVNHNAVLVADGLNLSVLDGAQGVYHVGEAGNTGSKGSAYIGINQSHLGSFVVILIMHVLDQVQHIHIQISQPVHHAVILLNDLIIVQVLGSDRLVLGTNLLAGLYIHTAVDSVQQALSQVGSCAEELHLFTGLGSGYAAADAVIVAPYRLHHIVVLILDGAGADRNVCRVLLKVLRQSGGIQNSQVRLRRGTHILQSVQETVVVLGNHRTAVYADTANFQGSPYRVAGKQLVVRGNTGELHHTELHNQVVDQFLCLALGQSAGFQISLNVDIQESGHTTNAHRSTVLGLDGSQVAEVQPLHSLFCILCGLRNIKAILLGHDFHLAQSLDLHSQLFSLTDDVVRHRTAAAVGKVFLLLLDQEVDTVQSHTAIIADDTATAVSIRQTGNDLVVASLLHLGRICVKHALVMRLAIFGEDLVQLRIRLIAVSGASLLRHLDTAIGHKGTLQGLVGLQTNHSLQILQILTDVARLMGSNAGHDLRVHIQNAALGALFFLQTLQHAPQLVGSVRGSCQEMLISIIGLVVLLDEVSYIDFLFPEGTVKAIPLFKIDHRITSYSICLLNMKTNDWHS